MSIKENEKWRRNVFLKSAVLGIAGASSIIVATNAVLLKRAEKSFVEV